VTAANHKIMAAKLVTIVLTITFSDYKQVLRELRKPKAHIEET
jgi:hypothetical protein